MHRTLLIPCFRPTQIHRSDIIPSNIAGSLAALRRYSLFLGRGSTSVYGPAKKVRGKSHPTSQEVCLNYLFTHVSLANVAGVAHVASPRKDVVGGICERYLLKHSPDKTPEIDEYVCSVACSIAQRITWCFIVARNHSYLRPAGGHRLHWLGFHRHRVSFGALNTGLSTTKSTAALSTWSTTVATAHELAHAFGARHTCTDLLGDCASSRGTECNPSTADGGPFLMYPRVTYGVNARKVSPCSVPKIKGVVSAKGQCLVQVRKDVAEVAVSLLLLTIFDHSSCCRVDRPSD